MSTNPWDDYDCETCGNNVWGSECYPCKDRFEGDLCPDTNTAASTCYCVECIKFWTYVEPSGYTRTNNLNSGDGYKHLNGLDPSVLTRINSLDKENL